MEVFVTESKVLITYLHPGPNVLQHHLSPDLGLEQLWPFWCPVPYLDEC